LSIGGRAFAVKGNVLDQDEMESIRDIIIEKYGRLDILINAAGGNTPWCNHSLLIK
jgi:NAD(P)-dependent dehydrogenase (short-subunit alcohol dehydrogenase family)